MDHPFNPRWLLLTLPSLRGATWRFSWLSMIFKGVFEMFFSMVKLLLKG
jgi:hypothetical protein